MSLAQTRLDGYRALANRVRAIPGQHGLRPYTVHLVTASTDGEYTGDGERSEVLTEILESGYPPKVRWLKDDEIAIGNGIIPPGTISIGPVTPDHSTGGTALTTIIGSGLDVGEVHLVRITGPRHPDGADYRVIGIGHDRAIHYTIRAAPVGQQE